MLPALAYSQQKYEETPKGYARPVEEFDRAHGVNGPAAAKSPSPAPSPAAATGTPAAKHKAPVSQATQAPGRGNGQVWVNTEAHVYHKEGSKWYGKTKKGKYMSEAAAVKEGDRPAKNEKQ